MAAYRGSTVYTLLQLNLSCALGRLSKAYTWLITMFNNQKKLGTSQRHKQHALLLSPIYWFVSHEWHFIGFLICYLLWLPNHCLVPGMCQCRALYEYKAAQSDELDILPGDIIMLTAKLDGGWWQGELHNKTGIFPASYVEEIGWLWRMWARSYQCES